MDKQEAKQQMEFHFSKMQEVTKQIGEVLKGKGRDEEALKEATELQRKWTEHANLHMEGYKVYHNL